MVRRWICNLHGLVPRTGFSGMAVVLNIKYSHGKQIDDDDDDDDDDGDGDDDDDDGYDDNDDDDNDVFFDERVVSCHGQWRLIKVWRV